jgi:hypothetical protein
MSSQDAVRLVAELEAFMHNPKQSVRFGYLEELTAFSLLAAKAAVLEGIKRESYIAGVTSAYDAQWKALRPARKL